jgi:hypothetical protein
VRQEALGCLEIFAGTVGYVFNTVHNIQAKNPGNVVALAEALQSSTNAEQHEDESMNF